MPRRRLDRPNRRFSQRKIAPAGERSTESGLVSGVELKFPDPEISETLLSFAVPVLGDLSGEAPDRQARQALEICFMAWNAVILADVLKDQRYLDELRRFTKEVPVAAAIVEHLIARKRAFFADDERLIGKWEVTRTPHGINVWAEARDPYSLPGRGRGLSTESNVVAPEGGW